MKMMAAAEFPVSTWYYWAAPPLSPICIPFFQRRIEYCLVQTTGWRWFLAMGSEILEDNIDIPVHNSRSN